MTPDLKKLSTFKVAQHNNVKRSAGYGDSSSGSGSSGYGDSAGGYDNNCPTACPAGPPGPPGMPGDEGDALPPPAGNLSPGHHFVFCCSATRHFMI